MYGPVPARLVTRAQGDYAGACRWIGPYDPPTGWFVSYRTDPKHARRCEAVINLWLRDLSGSVFSGWVPFLVDTGTDVTIIPRRLLSLGAFTGVSVGSDNIGGLVGPAAILGHYYAASLMFRAPKSHGPPIAIDRFEALIAAKFDQPHAVLGLDVIRRLIMVSDFDHVAFWPPPKGSPAAYLSR